VIVFTAFDTDERIFGALQAGAKAIPQRRAREIFRAIAWSAREVRCWNRWSPPACCATFPRRTASMFLLGNRPAWALDLRERQALNLLAQGLTNQEIADRLVISERTAKFHVSSILRKLGANNRTEAVSIAAQLNLIKR
jgi:DNA-binding NarL/FixJ family response regulator